MFYWKALLAWSLLAVVLGYCLWQVRNYRRWQRLTQRKPSQQSNNPSIAVVVPYRNELANLPELLNSLYGQSYPNFSVVLINDHSTDGGPAYVDKYVGEAAGARDGKRTLPSVLHLSLADHHDEDALTAHKKAALTLAISRTEADIILTTDADCTLPSDALCQVAASWTPTTQVLLGPVFNAPLSGFCHHFQALDLAAYQFLTATSIEAGTPTLANGACFGFSRAAFLSVGGYAGVDHLPSGDDVLLLHKLRAQLPANSFAWMTTTTAVTTRPVDGWLALWRQRLRWASKAGSYRAPELELAQALAFAACMSLLILLFLTLHPRSRPGMRVEYGACLLIGWVGKAIIDYRCLQAISKRYGQQRSLVWYLPTALLYPFFLVAVGAAALLGFKTKWKGRKEA